MPAPIPDLSRDQQCHHYQAPTGQRCGSPALKSEYYCYHHHLKHAKRAHRVLIDPEVTCMELPPIEDRGSIFIALAAVVHRLAENTIDTRRAGQMIYGLQVAMRALEPPPSQCAPSNKRCHPERAQRVDGPRETAPANAAGTTRPQNPVEPEPPKTIPITKQSLLYFLRSRHCYNCNVELFPPEELTYRRNAGAPPEIVEENDHIRNRLAGSDPYPVDCSPALLLDLNAAAEAFETPNRVSGASNLSPSPLPLSAVFVDNGRGRAWPDRTSSAIKFRMGSRGRLSPVSRRVRWMGIRFPSISAKLLASRGGWPR